MAVYYIDNVRGNDTNDGASPSTPWKELTKIASVAAGPGDKFLLEEESVWYYPPETRVVPATNWTGTKTNPVVIDRYRFDNKSPRKKPTIRYYVDIPANAWTWSAPNNAWLYTSTMFIGDLCMIQLGPDGSPNQWAASRTTPGSTNGLPLPSTTGRYWTNTSPGTSLYMYTPGGGAVGTDPTTYFGRVRLGTTNVGFITISSGRGYVAVRNLQFEDSGCCVYLYSGTAVDVQLTVENCTAIRSSRPFGCSGDVPGQARFIARNNTILDGGSCGIHVNGQGVTECDIYKNTCIGGGRNYSQGSIYVQARNAALRTKIHHNYIEGALHGTPDKVYDGMAIYAETGGDNIDVYCNTVVNTYAAFCDNTGRTTRWYNNVLINCWNVMWCDDDLNNGATNHSFFNNTCLVGNTNLSTGSGPGTTNIGWRCVNDGSVGGTLSIRNNVFYNIGASINSGAAIIIPNISHTLVERNNSFYGFTYTIRQNNSPFNVISATSPVMSVPLLTTDGKLLPASPLIGAGFHLGYIRDFDSRQRPKPPSIGAYDVAKFRKLS